MIEQQATVAAIDGADALVEVERQGACGSCAVKGGCGTSVIAGLLPRRRQLLRVANSQGALVGDRVEIGLPEAGLQTASLLMYGLPLLTLIAAAAAGQQLGGGDLAAALAGGAGLAVGLWLVRRLAARAARLQPTMLRRLPRGTVPVSALQTLQQ